MFWPRDLRFGMDEHEVMEMRSAADPAPDFQLLQQLRQHIGLATALLQRRWNAVDRIIPILDRKLTVIVDEQAAVEGFRLQQIEMHAATDDQVIDLSNFAINLDPQIVNHGVGVTVAVMVVGVVSRIALACHAEPLIPKLF